MNIYYLYIYICISINAADRGSLEMDSRVLGDLALPLIVWYMFSIVYFFIYLIYQGRWPWYILMKMIPKERSSWVSVPWMFQYIVNSYPPFGNHAKMGIDNLCLHPFTLLFVEVPVRTNDHHSIVVQIVFFFWLGTSIKYRIYYIYVLQLIWVLCKWILGSFQKK